MEPDKVDQDELLDDEADLQETLGDGSEDNPPGEAKKPEPKAKKSEAAGDPVTKFHMKLPSAPAGKSGCAIMVGDAVAQVDLMDGCPVRLAAVNYERVPDGFQLTTEDLLGAGFVRY